MRSKKSKVLVLLTLLTLSVTLIFFIMFRFMYSVIETKSFTAMVNNTTEMMDVMRDLAVENVEFHIDREKASLSDLALDNGGALLSGDAAANVLRSMPLPEYGLDYIFYRPGNQAVSGRNVTNPAFYTEGVEDAWRGAVSLDGPAMRADDVHTMAISAPVYRGGKVQGILTVVLDGFCVSEWISPIQFPSGGGLAYIVDADGTNIAVSTKQNRDWVTTRYNAQEIVKTDPLTQTIADLEILPLQGKTGAGSYVWEGSRNYLTYAPMPKTGWGIFVGFYGATLRGYSQEITSGRTSANQVYMLALVALLCVLSILEVRWIGREQRDNTELTAQKDALAALHKKTEEQAALLMEHHRTILSSLDYAKKIQGNLLPEKKACQGSLSDFGLIWSPKDAVGGDFYWMKHFSRGSLFCVCDCTGHGVPGAMLTMLVATALDAIVDDSNYQAPALVMWQLEHKLVSVLNAQTEKQGKKGRFSDFNDGADLALLYIRKDNGVIFASANIHIFVCDGVQVTDHKGQRLHIGEGSIKAKEEIQTVTIPPDEKNRYYVASDGFFDQVGEQASRPFGYREFKRIILDFHEEPMEAVIDRLWAAFEQHRGTESRRDDVELMGFRA